MRSSSGARTAIVWGGLPSSQRNRFGAAPSLPLNEQVEKRVAHYDEARQGSHTGNSEEGTVAEQVRQIDCEARCAFDVMAIVNEQHQHGNAGNNERHAFGSAFLNKPNQTHDANRGDHPG